MAVKGKKFHSPVLPNGKTMQQEFAKYFVQLGGHGTNAAIQAGYSKHAARTTAYALLQNATVQMLIQKEQIRQVKAEGVTEAIGTLRQICTDVTAPHGARVEASKAILSIAKFAEKVEQSNDKPLNEMTIQELDDVINKGQEAIRLLEAEAVTVEGVIVVDDEALP